MADQTAARERAIEVLTEELEQHAGSGADAAEYAVDALLANPEVLRALAGAPTADVAMLAAESAAIANADGGCRCTEDDACWDHEALEMRAEQLLAAAPEGVDAADERYPRPRVAGRCPSCRGASLFLGAGGHVTCSRLDCPAPGVVDDQLHAEPGAEPDGMDLEAQGEMADQLAAAQAAIQRVRATVDDWEGVEGTSGFSRDLRRALDGDTTEEGR